MSELLVCPDPISASEWCLQQRQAGQSIGLVPTMGALHEGHLTLVDQAVAENDVCVVSIFVNPLQFNDARDFDAYPRDIKDDCRMLAERGCDMVFTGTLQQFFPGADTVEDINLLEPGPYAEGLEGEHRAGHFAGVRTIVDRLFTTTQPDRAYFGEKDFQQTLVVKDLAQHLGFPEIRVCPIQREDNGLAMSSRNQRLTVEQRQQAGGIYQALLAAQQSWQTGERQPDRLQDVMLRILKDHPLEIEYAGVRDPEQWTAQVPTGSMQRAQALIAARIGDVRLIDNLRLHGD